MRTLYDDSYIKEELVRGVVTDAGMFIRGGDAYPSLTLAVSLIFLT